MSVSVDSAQQQQQKQTMLVEDDDSEVLVDPTSLPEVAAKHPQPLENATSSEAEKP
ncbi:hypothetical protein EV182_005775, partial [Spiromyces aspiralis]